jgi:hypothetical protein
MPARAKVRGKSMVSFIVSVAGKLLLEIELLRRIGGRCSRDEDVVKVL